MAPKIVVEIENRLLEGKVNPHYSQAIRALKLDNEIFQIGILLGNSDNIDPLDPSSSDNPSNINGRVLWN
jgi:hypothetical protein